MSIQAVAWALDQDLPARPKLVLVSIANHANHTDGYCWLKAETIASEAACTPRSVYRFIGGLIRNGYLRKAQRKSEDGKQRANDYWILFERAELEWDWGANLDDDREPPESDALPPIDEPNDTLSRGEEGENVPHAGVDNHVESFGPYDSRVIRKDSSEPSESKPLRESRARAAVPRRYRPPPLPQLGVGSTPKEAKLVFVFEGSRAYVAWVAEMKRRNRLSFWHLTTSTVVDGRQRTGWWFPSLFPPQHHDPPSLASEAELDEFARSG